VKVPSTSQGSLRDVTQSLAVKIGRRDLVEKREQTVGIGCSMRPNPGREEKHPNQDRSMHPQTPQQRLASWAVLRAERSIDMGGN